MLSLFLMLGGLCRAFRFRLVRSLFSGLSCPVPLFFLSYLCIAPHLSSLLRAACPVSPARVSLLSRRFFLSLPPLPRPSARRARRRRMLRKNLESPPDPPDAPNLGSGAVAGIQDRLFAEPGWPARRRAGFAPCAQRAARRARFAPWAARETRQKLRIAMLKSGELLGRPDRPKHGGRRGRPFGRGVVVLSI